MGRFLPLSFSPLSYPFLDLHSFLPREEYAEYSNKTTSNLVNHDVKDFVFENALKTVSLNSFPLKKML